MLIYPYFNTVGFKQEKQKNGKTVSEKLYDDDNSISEINFRYELLWW